MNVKNKRNACSRASLCVRVCFWKLFFFLRAQCPIRLLSRLCRAVDVDGVYAALSNKFKWIDSARFWQFSHNFPLFVAHLQIDGCFEKALDLLLMALFEKRGQGNDTCARGYIKWWKFVKTISKISNDLNLKSNASSDPHSKRDLSKQTSTQHKLDAHAVAKSARRSANLHKLLKLMLCMR